jgi:hypothetical protein
MQVRREKLLSGLLVIGLMASQSVLAQRAEWLPKVGPSACTPSFCFYYQGPYAVERVTISSDRRSPLPASYGTISVALLRLGDGTSISFSGVRSPKPCVVGSRGEWVKASDNSYRSILCIPTEGKALSIYVAATAISDPPLGADRAILESETCLWSFNFAGELSLSLPYCIQGVASNNSFKPKPLRGSA